MTDEQAEKLAACAAVCTILAREAVQRLDWSLNEDPSPPSEETKGWLRQQRAVLRNLYEDLRA
jgi:hypothetical protein